MKKTTKMFLATLLAFVMMFSAFSVLNVYAISNNDNVPSAHIYYFNDYYPSVPKSQMETRYSMTMTYDHKWIDEQDFYTMIDNSYFAVVPNNSLVIIDIKTFIPENDYLETLFSYLKNYKGCETIFVTVYNLDEFDNTFFLAYVDQLVHSDFQRLKNFLVHMSMNLQNWVADSNWSIYDTTILIDGRLVDTDTYYGEDIDTLCEYSPFLCVLLEALADVHPYFRGNEPYSTIAEVLEGSYGFKFIVNSGRSEFTNIVTWETYEAGDMSALYEALPLYPWDYVCGVGYSGLETSFYAFLRGAQDYMASYYQGPFPVYLLEVDPLVLGDEGLVVMTDADLNELYGEEWREWDLVFAAMDAILDPPDED